MRAARAFSRAATATAGAVSFLTRAPLGHAPFEGDDVARGAPAFPLVGAGIGAAVGGGALLFHSVLPALPAAACALAAGAILTGCLHLDGLADTADALGAASRERALEVMRDPRIGSYGATALVLDLIVKTATVAALLEHRDLVLVMLVAGALSRAVAPPLALVLPYARARTGTGSVLSGRLAPAPSAGATLLAVTLAVLLLGSRGAAMAGATLALSLVLAGWYRHHLGGVTGDSLGAAIELSETLALLVALVTA